MRRYFGHLLVSNMGGPGGNPLWGWTQPESGAGLVFQVRCAGFTLFVSVFVSVYVSVFVSAFVICICMVRLMKFRERKKERKQSLKSRNLKSFLEFSKVKLIAAPLCHFYHRQLIYIVVKVVWSEISHPSNPIHTTFRLDCSKLH